MTLKDLKEFFASVELPTEMRLSDYEYITDVQMFVASHINFLEHNSGNKRFMPYYKRLVKLKEKLES